MLRAGQSFLLGNILAIARLRRSVDCAQNIRSLSKIRLQLQHAVWRGSIPIILCVKPLISLTKDKGWESDRVVCICTGA